MKTALFIEYFDTEAECYAGNINISKYDLKRINDICSPISVQDYDESPKIDYEYYWGREIDEKEFNELREYIHELRSMDFSKYIYTIATCQDK